MKAKAQLLCQKIKFYWNTPVPFCSEIIYDCFHLATEAEPDHTTPKAYKGFTLWPHRKSATSLTRDLQSPFARLLTPPTLSLL